MIKKVPFSILFWLYKESLSDVFDTRLLHHTTQIYLSSRNNIPIHSRGPKKSAMDHLFYNILISAYVDPHLVSNKNIFKSVWHNLQSIKILNKILVIENFICKYIFLFFKIKLAHNWLIIRCLGIFRSRHLK